MYLQIAIALRATAQSTHAVRDSFIQRHIAPHCNILGAGTRLQIAIALRATAQSARAIRDSFIRQHTAPHCIPLQHTWRGYASPHPHCTTLRYTPTHLARAHISRLRSPSKYTHAHEPLHTHNHTHTHTHTRTSTHRVGDWYTRHSISVFCVFSVFFSGVSAALSFRKSFRKPSRWLQPYLSIKTPTSPHRSPICTQKSPISLQKEPYL